MAAVKSKERSGARRPTAWAGSSFNAVWESEPVQLRSHQSIAAWCQLRPGSVPEHNFSSATAMTHCSVKNLARHSDAIMGGDRLVPSTAVTLAMTLLGAVQIDGP